MLILIPAFVVSEMQKGFEIGFLFGSALIAAGKAAKDFIGF